MDISILVVTYNHEKYIGQALNSILVQRVNATYEILILDDASTDATPRILKEYKEKYSKKIRLYLRNKNSCHPTKNGYFLIKKAKGRYIAFLEGDDYWNDEFKLESQYKFLENNQMFSACVADTVIVDKNGRELSGLTFSEQKKNHVYAIQDFTKLRTVGMQCALLARNYFDNMDLSILYQASPVMGDITLFMLCVLNGPIYQMKNKMAAYRYVSAVGETNFNSIHKENIYKDYMIFQYWIRLENYMKKYNGCNFEFAIMLENIKNLSSRYSAKAMLHLIGQSKKWREYLLVYATHKYLLDSDFVQVDQGRNGAWKGRAGNRRSWWSYLGDKRPVILFGAGAAAAEYIDRYAWQGNILFLIDNDTEKQNRSFKGFLVKKPEEILKYRNSKVLIANKEHEEEMGKQLRCLGVKDFYCYCSMQSKRLKNMAGIRIVQKYEDETK